MMVAQKERKMPFQWHPDREEEIFNILDKYRSKLRFVIIVS
jgi:hypothetical protein